MRISSAERREFRLAVAKRETPRALLMTGGVFVAMVMLNWALGLSTTRDRIIDLIIVTMLLACWATISRPSISPRLSPWAFVLFATALIVGMVAQIWVTPSGPGFTYVLLVFAAAGPLTLSWLPILIAGAPMLGASFALATQFASPDRENWMVVSVAAFALGLVLMQVRLHGIDALALSQAEVRATATHDRLTGVLNRVGIEERLSEIAGIAARHGEQVFVAFVDVDGLKAANDRHGHEFGDEVLRTVAEALRACVRLGDLIGRWGGDEFIVVGVGHPEDPELLAARIGDRIAASGVDLTKWTGAVSVGTATAFTSEREFEDLLRDADEDMYSRRRQRRSA